MACYSQSTKFTLSDLRSNIWDCYFPANKDNLPTITPLGSRVKAISNLPIPLTVRVIKSFIGCVIYLAQFLPKLSELIKPINDILKNCNKVDPADIIQPLPLYAK